MQLGKTDTVMPAQLAKFGACAKFDEECDDEEFGACAKFELDDEDDECEDEEELEE